MTQQLQKSGVFSYFYEAKSLSGKTYVFTFIDSAWIVWMELAAGHCCEHKRNLFGGSRLKICCHRVTWRINISAAS